MKSLASFRKWLHAYWLDAAIPITAFLLAAGIYREVHFGQQRRQYDAWERHIRAASDAQNRGKAEAALRELQAAARSAPKDSNAHTVLAQAFKGVRQPERAAEQMELALHTDKPNHKAALEVVRIYCDIGKFADAKRVLDKEVKSRWPEDADSLFFEGIIALYSDTNADIPKALSSFEASLSKKPENLGTRFRYGICLARLGRYTDAERELRTILKSPHPPSGVLKELAAVLQKQGKSTEAEKMLARLQHLNDVDQMIGYIESRRHVGSGNVPPEDLLELGGLYLETGNLTEAESALAEYELLRPTDPRVHRKLAEVYRRMHLTRSASSKLAIAAVLEKSGRKLP